MTSTDRPDSERAAFERRFATGHAQTDRLNFMRCDGLYIEDRIQALWEGWDAARTPLDQPAAVAWQWKVPASDVWHESSKADAPVRQQMGYDIRALGVLPFTASPDSVREALPEAQFAALHSAAEGLIAYVETSLEALNAPTFARFMDFYAPRLRAAILATKGQS